MCSPSLRRPLGERQSGRQFYPCHDARRGGTGLKHNDLFLYLVYLLVSNLVVGANAGLNHVSPPLKVLGTALLVFVVYAAVDPQRAGQTIHISVRFVFPN